MFNADRILNVVYFLRNRRKYLKRYCFGSQLEYILNVCVIVINFVNFLIVSLVFCPFCFLGSFLTFNQWVLFFKTFTIVFTNYFISTCNSFFLQTLEGVVKIEWSLLLYKTCQSEIEEIRDHFCALTRVICETDWLTDRLTDKGWV